MLCCLFHLKVPVCTGVYQISNSSGSWLKCENVNIKQGGGNKLCSGLLF